MNNIRMAAGISSLLLAFTYICAFAFFGLYWSYPYNAEPVTQLAYLEDNQTLISLIYTMIYIVFGVVLSVLVVGLHSYKSRFNKELMNLASLFGTIWIAFVIASGMIVVIGLRMTLEIGELDPVKAIDTWGIISIFAESLGGGNELVGGLWVLLTTIVLIKSQVLSLRLHKLGIFVGVAGICTIYPAEILTEIFGISQIIWFIWLGINLMKDANEHNE